MQLNFRNNQARYRTRSLKVQGALIETQRFNKRKQMEIENAIAKVRTQVTKVKGAGDKTLSY